MDWEQYQAFLDMHEAWLEPLADMEEETDKLPFDPDPECADYENW